MRLATCILWVVTAKYGLVGHIVDSEGTVISGTFEGYGSREFQREQWPLICGQRFSLKERRTREQTRPIWIIQPGNTEGFIDLPYSVETLATALEKVRRRISATDQLPAKLAVQTNMISDLTDDELETLGEKISGVCK